ncbi:MAG: GNAT family N-acetyltransferase [Rhodospirillaceae bacterium]|nr:GNAT family N-acetyltransferase [Rhodospirillaceae bacterium]
MQFLAMIRKYKNSDVDAVVSVWRTASDLAHPFLSEAFQDKEQENVRNVYPQFAEIWVKEIEDKVVGFVALIENEVGAIFLDPNLHGQGIGREMMDFVIGQKGSVSLDFFKENEIGRRFYDRFGFVETKEYLHEDSGKMVITLEFTAT